MDPLGLNVLYRRKIDVLFHTSLFSPIGAL
jgi:hypothetical protein